MGGMSSFTLSEALQDDLLIRVEYITEDSSHTKNQMKIIIHFFATLFNELLMILKILPDLIRIKRGQKSGWGNYIDVWDETVNKNKFKEAIVQYTVKFLNLQ